MTFQPELVKNPSAPAVTYASSAQGSRTSGTAISSSRSRAAAKSRRVAKRNEANVADAGGTTLLNNDSGGFGLNRPYLAWNVYPTAQETTPPVSTSSGTFTSLLTIAAEPQHPKLRVRLRIITGAGTSGEVRLVDRASGAVLAGGGPLAVGIASTVETTLDGTLVAPSLSGSGAPMRVDVQARTTAGANTIALLVMFAMGKGS